MIQPANIKDLLIDKAWYLDQLKHKLGNGKMGKEIAKMLSILSCTEQLAMMRNEEFDGHILKHCIDYGVEIHRKNRSEIVPEILMASIRHLCGEVDTIVRRCYGPNRVSYDYKLQFFFSGYYN